MGGEPSPPIAARWRRWRPSRTCCRRHSCRALSMPTRQALSPRQAAAAAMLARRRTRATALSPRQAAAATTMPTRRRTRATALSPRQAAAAAMLSRLRTRATALSPRQAAAAAMLSRLRTRATALSPRQAVAATTMPTRRRTRSRRRRQQIALEVEKAEELVRKDGIWRSVQGGFAGAGAKRKRVPAGRRVSKRELGTTSLDDKAAMWTVPALKAQLHLRGLDIGGLRPALVKRLTKALDDEDVREFETRRRTRARV